MQTQPTSDGEIPLVSSVAVLRYVSLPLFAVHAVPNSGVLLVAPDIVVLGCDEQYQTDCRQGDENLVADTVVGFVVFAVDLGCVN